MARAKCERAGEGGRAVKLAGSKFEAIFFFSFIKKKTLLLQAVVVSTGTYDVSFWSFLDRSVSGDAAMLRFIEIAYRQAHCHRNDRAPPFSITQGGNEYQHLTL